METDEMGWGVGGGIGNPGFPVNDVRSQPMLFIKLTSVSQAFLPVSVC